MKVLEVKISKIKIGVRQRKDMGDLEGLAKSIREVGLLQPIGITSNYELIFGERRLRAYRDILGRDTIPARIIPVKSVLLGQIEENVMRKDFAPSELVAIVDTLRSFTHGGDRRSDQRRKCDLEKLTVDEAAKRAGLGGKDGYNRAKAVVQKGSPQLVEAMDSGKVSIATAAEIAGLPAEDQKESLRRGKKVVARDPNDFYPTPSYVTEALLQVEHFGRQVWEPACGDGAMSKVLEAAGYEVLSSDRIDRGYGEVENFLTSNRKAESIVTNPPFDKDDEFVQKALESTTHRVAMLLPLTFLEGPKRVQWLRMTPLKTVHVFARRVNLCKNGEERRKNGRFVFAWFVWEHGYSGPPTISWIEVKRKVTPLAPTGGKSQVVPAAKTIRLPAPAVNSVTQGDCRDLIPLLPDKSIHLCLCSPPYADQRKGQYPGVPEKEYPQFTVEWMSRLFPKLTDSGSVLVVIDPHVKQGVMADYVLRTQLALREAGWKEHKTQMWFKWNRLPLGHKWWPKHCYEQILWFSKTSKPFCHPKACGHPSDDLFPQNYKHSEWTNGKKGRKSGIARVGDVFVVPVGTNGKQTGHPAQFPVPLAERLIATFSPAGGTILDCFAGSGSTLVAVKRLGRSYYGFDIMPEFCKIARKRLATAESPLPKAG